MKKLRSGVNPMMNKHKKEIKVKPRVAVVQMTTRGFTLPSCV